MINEEILKNGLVKYALDNGGNIMPLLIDSNLTGGTGLMNPSVFVSHNGEIIVNIRHVNYTLFHSESKVFQHQYGPLQYLHPENDRHLRTANYVCKLKQDLSLKNARKIDMQLDKTPLWEFIGLEDARLVFWDGEMYLSGVRRDTTTNGQGRIELSKIVRKGDAIIEIARTRIPSPSNDDSYCEKNWMPVLDKPFTWVKWTNPTEIVTYNPGSKTISSIVKEKVLSISHDIRGGSQVVKIDNRYIAICHDVDLYKSEGGNKDGLYRHRLVVWDEDFNIMDISERFDFMGADIEFCCGLAVSKNDLLITFGFQDNAAFILQMPKTSLL